MRLGARPILRHEAHLTPPSTLFGARLSLQHEALCSRLSARGPLLPPPLAYEAHLTRLFSIDTRLPRLNVLKDNMFSLARSSLWHNVPAVVMSLFFFVVLLIIPVISLTRFITCSVTHSVTHSITRSVSHFISFIFVIFSFSLSTCFSRIFVTA